MPRIASRRPARALLSLALVTATGALVALATGARAPARADTTSRASEHATPNAHAAMGCPPAPRGAGIILAEAVPTIFLERGPGAGVSPMNVVYHPDFGHYYAANGGDPAHAAWVYDEAGNRIQDLPAIGVDVRAWSYVANPGDTISPLEIVSFDAQLGDGGNERGLIEIGLDGAGLLTGDTLNLLPALPGLINRQTAPSYDPERNVFYSRGLGSLVHVVDHDSGELVCTIDLDFDAAGVVDEDVLAWSVGYDPDLRCLIVGDRTNDRALVFDRDGAFDGASAIDMNVTTLWGIGYTNGQLFIWSDERNGWQGYVIKEADPDPCSGCPCPEDVDRNGTVDFQDLVSLLSQWGDCPPEEASGRTTSRLLGLSSDEATYEIDPATGQATFLATLWADANRVGLSALGRDVYGSDLITDSQERQGGREVALVDPDTGTALSVSDQDMGDWHGLASDESSGLLYSIDHDDNYILKSLDPKTGVVTAIGTGTGIDGNGMAYDDGAGILYATHFGVDESASGIIGELYTVDTATGVATLVGSTGVPNLARVGLAFDEENRVLYLNESGVDQLYTLDVTTGQATLVGANLAGDGTESNIDGLAWQALDPCDACPCPADVNRDGVVDFQDIVQLLAAWGACKPRL